jgi:hypothetical protein
MKTNQMLGLIAGCLLSFGVHAQFFSDDFSNPSNWAPHAGNQTTSNNSNTPGTMAINNSQLQFRAFMGSQTYRLQRDIGRTLNANDNWRVEYEFTVTQVNIDNTTVMALTDNVDHWQSNIAGGGSIGGAPFNTTSSIQVIYADPHGADRNIKLSIRDKYLDTWNSGSALIDIVDNKTYYIRAERVSNNKSVLSVYSDSARTLHIPGSPVCDDVDPRITGLRYIQSSVGTSSGFSRLAHVNIDNLDIFDNTIERCEETCEIIPSFSYVEDCDGKLKITNNSILNGSHIKTLLSDGKSGSRSVSEIGLGGDLTVQYPNNGTYTVCITVFGNTLNADRSLDCCSITYCEDIEVTTAEESCIGIGDVGKNSFNSNSSINQNK